MTDEQLEKINNFTRRDFNEDELYVFSVILCDNDIDRDGERFSETALEELQALFIGKTGIFDHNAKSSNQNARIFDTEVISDESRLTKNGETYKYLKAYAYMVKTDENQSLISEIDGGIKKEVSISCSASQRICSVCGCDKSKTACAHVKWKSYNGKLCHTILSGIIDAYEWSFVAVPAQINAGVTKKFPSVGNVTAQPSVSDMEAADCELKRDIRRLAFISGGFDMAEKLSKSAEFLSTKQLIDMKKSLENNHGMGIDIQLAPDTDSEKDDTNGFSMK